MMKRLLGLLLLVLMTFGAIKAQCPGGGGSGSGSGSGQGNHGYHSGASNNQASPYQNWPMPVRVWLDNGAQGPIPLYLVARVRIESRPWLLNVMQLSQGQILQKWNNGEITVVYLPTTPPSPILYFRVSYGGGITIISIGDDG